MASYIARVDVDGTSYPVGSSLYGACDTAANAAAKVASLSNFDKLVAGVTVHIKFTYSNTAASPTLNINSTGAKNIYRYGTTAPGNTVATSWNAGAVVSFTYAGDAWVMNDWVNSASSVTTQKLVKTTVPNVTNVGTVPALTITSTACDDITAWTTNTATSASVADGVLSISTGTSASLSYTARSVGSASGWSAGTTPTLGTAIAVATGATSASGTGDSVVTSVT